MSVEYNYSIGWGTLTIPVGQAVPDMDDTIERFDPAAIFIDVVEEGGGHLVHYSKTSWGGWTAYDMSGRHRYDVYGERTDAEMREATAPSVFLPAMYPNPVGDVVVARAVGTASGPIFPMSKWHPRSRAPYTHGCVATLGPAVNASGNPARTRSNVLSMDVIALDDVGTKAERLPIPVSAMIETRPDNFTHLFRLTEPCRDIDLFCSVMQSLGAAGHCDPGSLDEVRLYRLPGSKPPGKEHRAELVFFDPDRSYDINTFLDLVNVVKVAYDRSKNGYRKSPAPMGVEVNDPVFDWLDDQGMVMKELTGGWHMIQCPWRHEHSDQREDGGRYNMADEEDTRRHFMCHHSHGHSTDDFLDWVVDQGSPDPRIRNLMDLVAAGVEPVNSPHETRRRELMKEFIK